MITDIIIKQLLSNFDIGIIIVINVATYILIKCVDDLNGDKVPTTWEKRFIFVFVALFVAIIFKYIANIPTHIIINSCIVSPVSWSWVIKPIANKLGIDYKKESYGK